MEKPKPTSKRTGANGNIVSITSYLIVIVYVIDQLSKKWVSGALQASDVLPVTSFLNLVLVWNHGWTVDLFGYDFAWVVSYILIAMGLVFFFALGRWRLETTSVLAAIGIGLSMGGILGNLTDRLRLGASLNFLDFHTANYHWPSFNLADIATYGGILLLILEAVIAEKTAVDQ